MPLSLSAARTLDVVTDRDVLAAAARDVRTVMRRRQAKANALDPAGWEPPDPVLLALAVECDVIRVMGGSDVRHDCAVPNGDQPRRRGVSRLRPVHTICR